MTLINILRKRLHNTVPSNLLHSRGDRLDEPLITAEVITEQVLDVQQLPRRSTPGTSASLELVAHGVDDFKRLPVVVHTVEVAEPSRGDETQPPEGPSHPDGLGDGRHDELRHLARGVETDTRDLVHDRGVGEPLDQRAAVVVDVDAWDLGEERLDFVLLHLLDEFPVYWVLHHFVDVFEPG